MAYHRQPITLDALWDRTMARIDGAPTEHFREYEHDPSRFASEVLGIEPWALQRTALAALDREPQLTIRSSHGVGKTFLASAAALWWVYAKRPSLVLSTAPTARQVESLLWAEIGRLWARSKTPLPGRCLNTRLDASIDQQAMGLTTTEPEKFAGWHCEHLLVIVDEASGVPDKIFEVIQGTLTSADCKLLLIGNPTKTDGFFALTHQRWPERQKLRICSLDSPNFARTPNTEHPTPPPCPWLVTPTWVEARRNEWGEDSDPWRVRVMGEFPLASPDALIELAWVEAAHQPDPNTEHRTPNTETPRVLGLDVARYGDCETVAAIRRGSVLTAIHTWRGADLMTTCGKAIALAREHECTTIAVDTAGLGGGVLDRLMELQREDPRAHQGFEIRAFEAGGRPTDPAKWRNQRAEAYWTLRERYRERTIQHAGEWHRLTGQLTSLRYGYTSAGQLTIETKDEMRKRGLASPDWADAVAIAFAPEASCFCLPVTAGHTRHAGL